MTLAANTDLKGSIEAVGAIGAGAGTTVDGSMTAGGAILIGAGDGSPDQYGALTSTTGAITLGAGATDGDLTTDAGLGAITLAPQTLHKSQSS